MTLTLAVKMDYFGENCIKWEYNEPKELKINSGDYLKVFINNTKHFDMIHHVTVFTFIGVGVSHPAFFLYTKIYIRVCHSSRMGAIGGR